MRFKRDLTLIADLGDIPYGEWDKRDKRLGDILVREGVAPVAQMYASSPDAIRCQLPAADADTPPMPAPPR